MTATDASIAVAKRMKTVDITEASEEPIVVKGWVRTVRKQKTLAFVEVNDGSSLAGIQCVLGFDSVDDSTIEEINNLTTGSSVEIHGTAIASQGGKQSVEISASSMRIVGECPPDTYPLAKKRHSLEYLRTIAHLRPRTNTLAAVARVRSTLAQEIHAFFASQGFVFVHTPLITASDCEGAGEMFRVTTLDLDDVGSLPTLGGGESAAVVVEEKEEVNVEELEGKIASKGGEIRDLKAEGISKADLKPHIDELLALKAQLPSEEDGDDSKTQTTASSTSEGVDYAEDFFGKPAFLTVSGQLGGETHACALGDVYTFGPTFRAENSQTTRHLAEFHMVEPEMAFADLTSAMDNAESMLKQVVGNVLEKCMADVTFFNNFYEKGLIQRLTKLVDTPFVRISYREAVECLKEEIEKDPSKWQFPDVEFGTDLATEHERWLAETKFESAVFVYNYPKSIKAFYMRDNDEDGGETVNAMDLLVPGVGELVGGSQREERLDVLEQKISELGLDKEDYWWYLDLRRFGSVPHSGYGLGFERLVCYVCGIENIRDAIAFPRYPGNAEF
eukprot:CAMPEP_0195509774 /NCGR_PEP_ID=MMETSP0794_2-20130614/2616_1 /TAXON_ID=515487 /ORGANISM="Stephanopyxis turris, Strain CCMP 815" /LENGTH=559 /DNA_ID=CAMNT_0040637071 /DNA_START=262 /DNA_END=1941 /DNA_ORIENTATION=+